MSFHSFMRPHFGSAARSPTGKPAAVQKPSLMNARLRTCLFAAFACLVVAACGNRGSAVLPASGGLNAVPQYSSQDVRSLESLTRSALLYVANRLANSVTEYRATANGNATPTARIRGNNTNLNQPSSLGLDSSRRLYVLNFSSIAVYPAGAIGNARPEFLLPAA